MPNGWLATWCRALSEIGSARTVHKTSRLVLIPERATIDELPAPLRDMRVCSTGRRMPPCRFREQ
eukprot:scaffold318090_cov18-Prasinocladus_malaysianus.AAC.1